MKEETRQTLVTVSRPMRMAAAAALGMLAIFLVVKTFDAMARFGEGDYPQINTITVSGTGVSSAKPDIAKISFTVQEQASDVTTAQNAAAKKGNDAIAAMKVLGIEDKDIKTAAYTISPQYSSQNPCFGAECPRPVTTNPNTIIGYEVSQSVEVTIRDTNKASDVLSKLGTIGVQNVSGPNFMVDDDSGVTNMARAEAIKNAQDKAKQLAKELGVSLVSVVSYSDQPNNAYPMFDKAMSSEAVGAPAPVLPVGSDERTVTVQITYRIK